MRGGMTRNGNDIPIPLRFLGFVSKFVYSETSQEKRFQFQIKSKYKSMFRPPIVSMQSARVIIIL